ncbi:class I SAM-dependent DNA methyltransferase [Deinococcus sp. NW-56]|uniref:type I restriction-modification system subunit M n=1 Tax=Deinococcus sp. NW-56 TaxID=2080419 RepID=UPI0018F878FD|nr:class I SAM-dependent DNA methyltransferase [Deinococcus sp. NW-56]
MMSYEGLPFDPNGPTLTLPELEQRLWGAANVLRGPIDAADFKAYIFPLLFFKRISDVWDEEYQAAFEESGGDISYATFKENHRFQIPDGHHWRDVFAVTENVGFALAAALRAIEQANPDTLYGIFGDAQWTNKARLPDALMRQLLDGFQRLRLGNRNVREDVMGQAYEYLIKKFADSSNKAAGEFYTPRAVVRLMVNMLHPQARESIYDPTVGTGGIPLEAVHHIRESGGEWRNLVIRGQELNLTTQAIARMNLFLHGIEDFKIARGDTLQEPAFHQGDELDQFDCVLANPPFSLKGWGADRWAADPYGRGVFGVPTDGNADYAWIMHMLKSLKPGSGRMAVVMPLGVLFRGGREGKIRQKLIQGDYVEAVVELGPNLFYGTGIPACILVLRLEKEEAARGSVYFVDASRLFTKARAQNFMTDAQADEIHMLYRTRADRPGLSRVVPIEEIHAAGYTLKLGQYLQAESQGETLTVADALTNLRKKLAAQKVAEDRLEILLQKAGHL